MKRDSLELAHLSDHVYLDLKPGIRRENEVETHRIYGREYRIIEHVHNSATGYQGTSYQRQDTGQVFVAHRGTEGVVQDVGTDGAMVALRVNSQAPEAIRLTARAIEFARQELNDGVKPVEVIVTGHSLGGALAQVTAHHFDLEGETFNAYGAASLSRRIPEGGSSVINHVMANDPVSAASPHYGEVRVYAKQNEIDTLSRNGYGEGLTLGGVFIAPGSRVAATASMSLESHKLGNFLGPHSVLEYAGHRELADSNRELIQDYRDDVKRARQIVPLGMVSGVGLAKHLIDEFRDPLPAGEPARREEKAREQPAVQPPSVPLKPLNGPGHVGYPLFIGALQGVHEQDQRAGRTPDLRSEQLAGALACRMHELGGKRIDHVVLSNDASTAFAIQGALSDPAHLRASVPTVAAMNTPLEQSGRQIESQASAQLARQDQTQEQIRSIGRGMS